MTAVPIYVWNGTAWQETGPTIPASPIKYQASAPSSPSTGDIWVDSDGDVTSGSTQLVRYRFVASGGETSLSGNDANGATLAYTAGMEQVVLNGAVLVRGYDYTATNGTSITGLSPALVANDVVEVFSFMAFNVANTYTQSQVDGFFTAPLFSAKKTGGTQSVSSLTWTKITFQTETYDTNGCFDSTTNYRFTPNKAGYYLFNAHIMATNTAAGTNEFICGLYKNGSIVRRLGNGVMQSTAGFTVFNDCAIAYANGSTDYFECYAYSTGGTTSLQDLECYFEGHWVRA